MSPALEPHWRTYLEWNARIASRFFSPAQAHQLAYLDVSRESLLELSRQHGETIDPIAQLVLCVTATLQIGHEHHSIFVMHRKLLREWQRSHSQEPPPCIALLGLLTYVAEQMSADAELSSTNYYGRLLRVLGLPASYSNELQRAFRRDTPSFWQALNAWLERWHGERGIPTAFAFDHRRYVGVPISQALLREADRVHLPECFSAHGLRGGQRISPADMARLLNEWIQKAPVSARLKHLWPQEHARARIAEIACIELEAWDGVTLKANAPGASWPLQMAVALRRLPRLRLDFALITRDSPSVSVGPCELRAHYGGEGTASERISAQIKSAPFPEYKLLQTGLTNLAERVLTANVCIESADAGSRSLERRWKQIVVLRYEPESQLYIETKRIELAETHIVLAHASIEPKASAYLQRVTSGELRRISSRDNPSIPSHWTAFLDVRVTGTAQTDQDELQALVPATTTNILFQGGLRLPGRSTWHSRFPPEITVVSLSSRPCAVSIAQALTEDGADPQEIALGKSARGATWPLQPLKLSSGEWRVVVRDVQDIEGAPVASARLHLSSADTPRMTVVVAIGHRPSNPLWPLTAEDLEDQGHGPVLSGARLMSWPQALSMSAREVSLPERVGQGAHEDGSPEAPSGTTSVPSAAGAAQLMDPVCVRRGHHYWKIPSAAEEAIRWQRLLGQCKDCGLERWFNPYRFVPHRKKGRRGAFQYRLARPIVLPWHNTTLDITEDDLLDVLTYLRCGSLNELAAMLEPLGIERYRIEERLRVMAALGHVDLVMTADGAHVEDWHIAEPTLVQIAPELAFLAGARSLELIATLEEHAKVLGGVIALERQIGAPSRLLVVGLCRDRLDELARVCTDSQAACVSVACDIGAALCHRLPPLPQLESALPHERWPDLSAERFDLATLTWSLVGRPTMAGAYRFGLQPRHYGFIDERALERREMRRADYRTVKHLAAIHASHPLIAYSSSAQALQVPLGAELPYLYERALVLASGLAPVKRADGIVQYHPVPPALAHEIALRMTDAPRLRPKELLCR